jgi:hypothetical protein
MEPVHATPPPFPSAPATEGFGRHTVYVPI